MIKSYEDIFKQDLIQHCNDNNLNITDFEELNKIFKYSFKKKYTFDCPLNFK